MRKMIATFLILVYFTSVSSVLAASEPLAYTTKNIVLVGIAVTVVLTTLVVLLVNSQRNLKNAKMQIEKSDHLRQTFMDADSNWIYLKDKNFNYVFFNQAFQTFYNKPADEIIGRNDFQLNESGFANTIRKTDQMVFDKRKLLTKEISNHGLVYIMTKFPVELPNGSFGVGAIIRNITEERRQERFKEKVFERNNILIEILSLSSQNTGEQLNYALQKISSLTESQYGYLYFYDEENEAFKLNSWTSCVISDCKHMKPKTTYLLKDVGVWGEVVRNRKPLVINNFCELNPQEKDNTNGHAHWENYMSVPIMIDDKIVAVVALANKQTEYDETDVMNVTLIMSGVWQAVHSKEAEDQLARERNKYLQTLISIGDGVMVVDIEHRVEMLNQVAQRLTGWTNEEALGKHYKEVFLLSHENPNQSIIDPIEMVMRTNTVQEIENHALLTSRDGARYHLEDSAAPILGQNGKMEGVVLVFRDVTEKKKQKKAIEYLSFHDSLTGLYNRRFFEEELKRIDVKRNLPISIIMGDVNGLKLTNDILGHAHGDLLLKTVAEVFQTTCRADDIIARWGGDEFVLLLPKTSLKDAEGIILHLKANFSKKQIKTTKVSVSMGLDSKTNVNENILDILDNAEEHMYSNKTIERQTMNDEEIRCIMTLLHELSPREQGHSLNVRELCKRLGTALNLSEVDLKLLMDASYIHDIGKIVLERDLLQNNQPLTEEEKMEVKRHPVVGFRILNYSNKTLDLAEAVLTHHECWDGSGYPKGLEREEIPLFARIIAVVSSYDEELYRTGNLDSASKEDAIQKIRDGIGMQFDPRIAERFIHLIESPS